MPTYEYKCKKCGREFEYEQRITEEPLKNCIFEDCEGEVFRKISKNIGLVFNGSGFYLTDYVHKKDKPPTVNGSKNGNGAAPKTEKTPVNGAGAAKKETAKSQ